VSSMVIVCEECGARFPHETPRFFGMRKGPAIRCRKCGGTHRCCGTRSLAGPPGSASIEAEPEIEPVAEEESGLRPLRKPHPPRSGSACARRRWKKNRRTHGPSRGWKRSASGRGGARSRRGTESGDGQSGHRKVGIPGWTELFPGLVVTDDGAGAGFLLGRQRGGDRLAETATPGLPVAAARPGSPSSSSSCRASSCWPAAHTSSGHEARTGTAAQRFSSIGIGGYASRRDHRKRRGETGLRCPRHELVLREDIHRGKPVRDPGDGRKRRDRAQSRNPRFKRRCSARTTRRLRTIRSSPPTCRQPRRCAMRIGR